MKRYKLYERVCVGAAALVMAASVAGLTRARDIINKVSLWLEFPMRIYVVSGDDDAFTG